MSSRLPTPPPDEHQSSRILLVDDNPTNLQVLVHMLNGEGYRLLVAKDGEHALAIAQKTQPELILLDIMMPGLDGYEVCRRLKADPKTEEAAVIFLSALDATKDKVRGLELGAVDYVSKPFQSEEVIARVRTHITIHRLQRDVARRNDELEHLNRKMKTDLDAAARVQQALLPTLGPKTNRAHFAWAYRPCDELAGDGLNVFQIDDRYVGLYVVDVSGHGVPSALLSVSVARNLIPHHDRSSLVVDPTLQPAGSAVVRPSEVAGRLNRLYPMDSINRQYFTLLYGVLDTQQGTFQYVSAGHPGPIVIREREQPQMYVRPAVPIGMMEGTIYEDHVLPVRPGDRLYLYSDGVSEETNGEDEPFGNERLVRALDASRLAPLNDSVQSLVDAVLDWRGAIRLSDDLSVLAVEIR